MKEVYSKKEKRSFKFKLSFITLTLSDVQKHSDEFIKSHLLEPFLKWMGRSHQAHSYIWKAEIQNNGNIHFHITTNKFIHWRSIRAKWNRLLSNHGYCKYFNDGSNDKGNSATQIKAVKNEKEIKGYIIGYVSKKDIFKKIKDVSTKKVTYINSEFCPLNNHFYIKENWRQATCSDGLTREYKRTVHGRIWSASVNLNQSAMVIKDSSIIYECVMQRLNDSRLAERKEYDFHNLYLHKQKIMKFMPITLRKELQARINMLRSNDVPQQKIEIESIY